MNSREFAARKHALKGQTYNGMPYTFHLDAVVNGLVNPTQTQIDAAYLHDTLEDTDTTTNAIHFRFGYEVLAIVCELTRNKGESYFDYIQRIKEGSDDARIIKLSDLRCNLRYADKESLRRRYERAIAILEKD